MRLPGYLSVLLPLGFAENHCHDANGQSCPGHHVDNVLLQLQRKGDVMKVTTDVNETRSQQDTAQALNYCRFATSFDWSGLATSASVQDDFVKAALTWDGKFVKQGTGMTAMGNTRDHVVLTTGGDIERTASYTAPSKESLHMSMLALTLDAASENPDAPGKLAHFWLAPTQDAADDEALNRLESIIQSYENWNTECPACGGFVPWVSVSDEGFHRPAPDGQTFKLPALDNGQMAWSMVAVIEGLTAAEGRGKNTRGLIPRFEAHVELMKRTAPIAFLMAKKGRVYSTAKPKDVTLQPNSDSYKGQKGKLADPFEGELMNFWIALFGEVSDTTRGKQFKKIGKASIANTYQPGNNGAPITIQEGWRFSAHEEWKYLVLPYEDVPNCLNLRKNNERARTWYSADNDIPGMKAACYDSEDVYIDRLGVEPLSYGFTPPPADQEMVTPYSAFPLILLDRGAGLSWYHAMVARPKMQSQLGSVESSAYLLDDPLVARFVTWDTKVTTDVAMAGGASHLARRYMQRLGKYDLFTSIVESQHARYADLSGSDNPYAPAPTAADYDGEWDWPNCVRGESESA